MRKFIRALMPALWLILPLTATAQVPLVTPLAEPEEELVRWYDVEILIFSQNTTAALNNERFALGGRIPDFNSAFDPLAPPSEDESEVDDQDNVDVLPVSEAVAAPRLEDYLPVPYSLLDNGQMRLNNVAAALRRSSRYQPLVHIAWTQPPLERNAAQAVRVHVPMEPSVADGATSAFGDDFGDSDSEGLPLDGEYIPADMFDPDKVRLLRPIDGTITLAVSRYLHLYLDLVYLPDDESTQISEAEWQEREQRRRDILEMLANEEISLDEAETMMSVPSEKGFYGYRLDQSRRMRTEELHYFDHPRFGVIATINRREIPVPAELVPEEVSVSE